MPLVGHFISSRLSIFTQRIGLRFTSKTSRFRLAVSSGFVIATVGFLVVGADMKFGNAETFWGMSFPGIGGDAPQAYRQPPEPSAQYMPQHHRRTHVVRHKTDEYSGALPVSLARQSMCVRLCDGFAFPVGNYHGGSDRVAHEATCQSECPGARTALFVVPLGAQSIGEAVQVGSDRTYSEIPEAFHYTTYVDATCSCHPKGGNRIKSLLHDFTLRRGDAIMTGKGLQVFHGGNSYPYKRRDFVALAKSRDIRKGDRENLRAIERASLVLPTTVASVSPPALSSDARPDGTAALEHQAKN